MALLLPSVPALCSTPAPAGRPTTPPPDGCCSTTAAAPSIFLVRWTPPWRGAHKLNFDGSVLHDGSGRASIGGILRDSTGTAIFAFAEQTDHAPIGVVEARALIRGLRLALQCGRDVTHRPLLVEGDDLTLVRLLRGESRQSRIPLAMENEILELLGRFRGGCQVQHVFREGNQVADQLTKEAYHYPALWLSGLLPTGAVSVKVQDDRRGVAHQRVRLPY